MKDKFFWVLLVLLIFQGITVNLLDNRITELEGKAKHFKCLEKRIRRFKPMRIRDNTGGGWYIVVDSLELETR